MADFKSRNGMNEVEYNELQNEMDRLANIKWQGYAKTIKEVGVSYLGAVAQSAKLRHSLYHKVSTYGIYLASANLSGFNVCPNSEYCKDNCLNGSGHNRLDRLSKKGSIDRSRIIKTRLFFANREVFMRIMIHEIEKERKKAEKNGTFFSIRLNCTSDINPIAFTLEGKNILEIFPDVQFYDYTKVPSRIEVAEKYSNYDITWSIDGSEKNREIGLEFLKNGGRVAVVYGENDMPKTWYGYECGNGDETDYRPSDIAPVCALKFKKTANNYVNGQFRLPNIAFIVTRENKNVIW